MDSESEEVGSESKEVSSESEELPDARTAPSDGPEEAVAPDSDLNRSQRLASSWVSDPERALLRQHVGSTADLDDKKSLHGHPRKATVPQPEADAPLVMPGEEAEQRFTRRPRHELCSTAEPGADTAGAASDGTEILWLLPRL